MISPASGCHPSTFGENLSSLDPLPTLRHATGFFDRLMGVWKQPLAPHDALWLRPCRAVHTLGLREPLDILFLDAGGQVLGNVASLVPNRWAWIRGASSVLELPGGYCQAYPLQVRTLLSWVDDTLARVRVGAQ